MLSAYAIQGILKGINYKDWTFIFHDSPPWWLQVRFEADGALQHGRKWLLSEHMTAGEIVQTAFKAVLTAEEHEAREKFLFRGSTIFSPHFDIDLLSRFAGDSGNYCVRALH